MNPLAVEVGINLSPIFNLWLVLVVQTFVAIVVTVVVKETVPGEPAVNNTPYGSLVVSVYSSN